MFGTSTLEKSGFFQTASVSLCTTRVSTRQEPLQEFGLAVGDPSIRADAPPTWRHRASAWSGLLRHSCFPYRVMPDGN